MRFTVDPVETDADNRKRRHHEDRRAKCPTESQNGFARYSSGVCALGNACEIYDQAGENRAGAADSLACK